MGVGEGRAVALGFEALSQEEKNTLPREAATRRMRKARKVIAFVYPFILVS
jgi:hypothetical protein